MGRLTALLRFFKLPSTATTVDLRQAYLQRVKQVHPDVAGKSSQDEFHELQQKFDEALKLLSTHDAGSATGRVWCGATGQSGGYTVYQAHARTFEDLQNSGRCPHGAQHVPVSGFPQRVVYPLTASLAVGTAVTGLVLSHKRKTSPSIAEVETSGDHLHHIAKQRTPIATRDSQDSVPCALALKPGPWNVPAALAISRGSWSPSNAYKFIDSDSFYANRVKGHLREGIGQRRRLGDKQGKQIKDLGYEADHEPQIRDGVEMLPVHAAAQDGLVWWLERCGASLTCRGMLSIGDACGDSPLHHAARHGVLSSCHTLLRLGSDPVTTNGSGVTPAALAADAGHSQIAALLQSSSLECAMRHPDGLGVLAEPPDGITFTGLHDSQCLRRALNMAVGYDVTPPLPVSKAMHNEQAVERIINVVRGSLQSSEFDLEGLQLDESAPKCVTIFTACSGHEEAPIVRGLLIYEAPGCVTTDAPGHWVAIRRYVANGQEHLFRLDPVRGSFRLTSQELATLLKRYPSWRVLQGSAQVALERTARLGAASQEAQALMQTTKCLSATGATGATQSV